MKFGLSMLTWIERIRIGMPPMMLGHGFGVGDDVGIKWVDVQGDADHNIAVVIGSGQRRCDRNQR